MVRFIKFAGIGILNTIIDLGVLNALVFAFGVGAHDELFILFKAVSFCVAVANSYFFNKYWVFQASADGGVKEPLLFFIISVVGFMCNVSASYGVFVVLHALGMPIHLSANAGALVGSSVVLGWNFIGYTFLVFN